MDFSCEIVESYIIYVPVAERPILLSEFDSDTGVPVPILKNSEHSQFILPLYLGFCLKGFEALNQITKEFSRELISLSEFELSRRSGSHRRLIEIVSEIVFVSGKEDPNPLRNGRRENLHRVGDFSPLS